MARGRPRCEAAIDELRLEQPGRLGVMARRVAQARHDEYPNLAAPAGPLAGAVLCTPTNGLFHLAIFLGQLSVVAPPCDNPLPPHSPRPPLGLFRFMKVESERGP